LPCRGAFLDEGGDAFLRVARHHVLGHDLGRIFTGFGEIMVSRVLIATLSSRLPRTPEARHGTIQPFS
jgi:hypothetical protein